MSYLVEKAVLRLSFGLTEYLCSASIFFELCFLWSSFLGLKLDLGVGRAFLSLDRGGSYVRYPTIVCLFFIIPNTPKLHIAS